MFFNILIQCNMNRPCSMWVAFVLTLVNQIGRQVWVLGIRMLKAFEWVYLRDLFWIHTSFSLHGLNMTWHHKPCAQPATRSQLVIRFQIIDVFDPGSVFGPLDLFAGLHKVLGQSVHQDWNSNSSHGPNRNSVWDACLSLLLPKDPGCQRSVRHFRFNFHYVFPIYFGHWRYRLFSAACFWVRLPIHKQQTCSTFHQHSPEAIDTQ